MAIKFNGISGQFDIVLDKASEIKYDNTTSGLTATDTQAAIDELDAIIDALPDPITYAGTWDAATNTPTLDNSDTGVTGFLYRVTVAGTVDFGAGPIAFDIGDSVVNNGTLWEKWDHSDQVLSVNTQTGAVVLDTDDISEGVTNLYFTGSRAQGAITGGASTITTANLTADRAVISNPSGKVAVSATTATELGYVSGVTSAIQTQLNDKADTDLSNLAPTAINEALVFAPTIAGVLKTADEVSASTQTIQINSGDAPGAQSGDINVASGTSGTIGTGNINIKSGDASAPDVPTGGIDIRSGAATGVAGSGGAGLLTGTAVDNDSGGISINTGDVSGTGNSGAINITTGTPISGVRGTIKLQDGSEGLINEVWTSTDASGSGNWAPVPANTAKNYLGYINNVNNNGNFELGTTGNWVLGNATVTSGLPTGAPTFGSGASGNLSIATVSSGQLAGAHSLSYASSAATTAGNFLASPLITIDLEDQAKVLTFKFAYSPTVNPGNANYSGTSANSYGVAIYDVTNSAWVVPAGVFSITQGSGVGIATGTFQTAANASQYRFVVYNANATSGAVTLYFDDFTLGPQTAPIAQFGIVGEIIATGSLTPPSGYLYCNGAAVSRIQYPALFAAIGATYGSGDGSTTFNIPDLRGRFLRGTNNASGRDPDAASRTAMNTGGNTGDNPGSVQTSQYQAHNHQVLSEASGSFVQLGGAGGLAGVSTSDNQAYILNSINGNPFVLNSGGNETRPINANVVYHICATNSVVVSNDTDTRIVDFRGTQTSEALTANTTNITFTTVKDSHGAWSTNIYTVQVAGDYVVGINGFTSTSGGTLGVYRNGTLYQALVSISSSARGNGTTLVTGCVPGDTISFRLDASLTLQSASAFINRLSGPSVVAATESVNMKYANTAGTSIANSGEVAVPFATKVFDSHNAFDGTTGIYTFPVSGKFRVTATCTFTAQTYAVGNSIVGMFYKNGAIDTYGAITSIQAAVSLTAGGTASTLLTANAGDTCQFRLTNTRTAGATTLNTTPGLNHIEIERIGN